jgi:predicted nucleic acid-binding protein
MLLLDTDICVDLGRGYPPAVAWFDTVPERPGLPGPVVFELLRGCRNSREAQAVRRRILPFQVYWPIEDDWNRAVETYARGHLSHNIGILDALIGECAVRLGAALCTFNQKHYRVITALSTLQPYPKS